jgi:hypothetical protein
MKLRHRHGHDVEPLKYEGQALAHMADHDLKRHDCAKMAPVSTGGLGGMPRPGPALGEERAQLTPWKRILAVPSAPPLTMHKRTPMRTSNAVSAFIVSGIFCISLAAQAADPLPRVKPEEVGMSSSNSHFENLSWRL